MRILWRIIAGFFRWTWRLLNFVRELVMNLFFLFLLLVGAGIWFQLNSDTPAAAPTQGALRIDLTGVIVDKPSMNDKLSKLGRELLGAGSDKLRENSLFELVDAIRQAKGDGNITGIVLDLRNFAGGDQPSLAWIGKALREFRDAGKPIYAFGDVYSQPQYYLASFANKIYLAPQGGVDLHGFATNGLYFKSLLDKLDVTSHVFRVGTYKSAVEPFLRDDMSPAAREADSRWIGELWQNYLNTVAGNRQITPQQLFPGAEGIIAGLQQNGGDSARYALHNKLVDELSSAAAFDAAMIKVFGYDAQRKDFNSIRIYDYPLRAGAGAGAADSGNIAVIAVNGAIMDGEETNGAVGGDTTAQQIRDARLNKAVKAIILRVNSPGGSVTASETIRAELAAAKAAGKPIVVSMGGMAASGGYWVSTPADFIIASPSTLTGSIGIFGVINTVENSLSRIGVHSDGVATSPLADVAATRALPPQVQQMMQITIEHGYKNFVDLVAASRKQTPEAINRIAQGHVWTGSDAKQNGLVDALGDFDDAVSQAATLAKVRAPTLVWYQSEPGWFDRVLNRFDSSARALLPAAVSAWLPPPAASALNDFRQASDMFSYMNDPQHRYAFCLTCGDVR
ncbi:signal peptide peptidase SppA [Pantoea sp. 1.19]|uniref:signal peptide peptidase SppA n=1 Tax=Pantoea sp. 1.19 TaxID=1925589 RepID=UPI000948FEAE|nr:signal peptide peptidase SppA [Pantoea sp. 1.19]